MDLVPKTIYKCGFYEKLKIIIPYFIKIYKSVLEIFIGRKYFFGNIENT